MATVAALALVVVGAGQLGLFSGDLPDNLGVRGGKLRGGDGRPNWVSSQTARSDAVHYIEPITIKGPPEVAWAALARAAGDLPGARVVKQTPDYLYVQFRSRVFGFVDDAEFTPDRAGDLIHVRSGARLGIRDFSVNRKRIETLRAALPA